MACVCVSLHWGILGTTAFEWEQRGHFFLQFLTVSEFQYFSKVNASLHKDRDNDVRLIIIWLFFTQSLNYNVAL